MSYLHPNTPTGHASTVRRLINWLTREHGGYWYLDTSDGNVFHRVNPRTGLVDTKVPFFDAFDATADER